MRTQTYVVTGCASGIGRHLAERLAQMGHNVVATDIDEDGLHRHAEQGKWPNNRVHTARLDVTDPQAWESVLDQAVERFDSLDVLLNVAGYLLPGWVHEIEPAMVHRHFDVNVKGTVFGTTAAARRMVARGRGHIVNMASLAALAPIPGLALYSASKYAVRAFSLAAAQELRPRGVFVTVVCPDVVQTPMLDLQRHYDEAALSFSGRRVLTVEDVAQVVLDRVLHTAPLQVFFPATRGWLARMTDMFPQTIDWVRPLLLRRGREKQASLRRLDGARGPDRQDPAQGEQNR